MPLQIMRNFLLIDKLLPYLALKNNKECWSNIFLGIKKARAADNLHFPKYYVDTTSSFVQLRKCLKISIFLYFFSFQDRKEKNFTSEGQSVQIPTISVSCITLISSWLRTRTPIRRLRSRKTEKRSSFPIWDQASSVPCLSRSWCSH